VMKKTEARMRSAAHQQTIVNPIALGDANVEREILVELAQQRFPFMY